MLELATWIDGKKNGGGWDVQMRKPRKKRSVMGWELRRQWRSPCFGCWGWVFIVEIGRERD